MKEVKDKVEAPVLMKKRKRKRKEVASWHELLPAKGKTQPAR